MSRKKKTPKHRWVTVEVYIQEGDPLGDHDGTEILAKIIPLGRKFTCELCTKKPKIFVADTTEKDVKMFCTHIHLYKFFKGDAR